MSDIVILCKGRRALTSSRAAPRYGIHDAFMRKMIERYGPSPLPEGIDGRTSLYLQSELDKMMRDHGFRVVKIAKGEQWASTTSSQARTGTPVGGSARRSARPASMPRPKAAPAA